MLAGNTCGCPATRGLCCGSLALIDDSPRQDFSPRQRHTLKEFAVGGTLGTFGDINHSYQGCCNARDGAVEGQGLVFPKIPYIVDDVSRRSSFAYETRSKHL